MGNEINKNESLRKQLLNIAVMAGGSWLIWYLSGPLTAEIGRAGYEWIYDKLWGTPTFFSSRFFEWAFVYTPNRSHLENWLYNYAEYAGPLLAAPLLYKLPDLIRNRVRKRLDQLSSLANSTEEADSKYVLNELGRVVEKLQDGSTEEREALAQNDASMPYLLRSRSRVVSSIIPCSVAKQLDNNRSVLTHSV